MKTLAASFLLLACAAPHSYATASAPQASRPGSRPAAPGEPPALLLQRADDALAQRRLDDAARLYAGVAERYESVRALLGLARVASQRGDPHAALLVLQKALPLAPNSEELLSANARVALAARAPVSAILALEPLTRIVPSVMEYQYLLGVALMQAGDMASAVFPLQAALELEPNRPLSLVALGLAFNAQKLYAEARPPLLRCLEVEPDNLEALAALAESEDGTGELAAAETHADRVLARASDHATANLVMGLLRMKQERYAEARGFLERAVASEPLAGKAHYQLSLACARLGDSAGQEQHLAAYREAQQQLQARLAELRGVKGATKGGMRP